MHIQNIVYTQTINEFDVVPIYNLTSAFIFDLYEKYVFLDIFTFQVCIAV